MNKDDDARISVMSEAPVGRAIIVMSAPMVLAMLVQLLYNYVDVFFIARLGDASQMAGASLTLPIFIGLIASSQLVGTGAASYISRMLGEGRKEEAQRTLCVSVLLLLALGAVLTVLGVLFSAPLAWAMGATETSFVYANAFIKTLFAGAIFIIGGLGMGQLLRAEGSAGPSMAGMIIGALVNLALDPVMLFVLRTGVAGVALATVIGNACSCLFYVLYYLSGKPLLKVRIALMRPRKDILREIIFVSVPGFVGHLLSAAALSVNNVVASGYGDLAVAAVGIAQKVLMVGQGVFKGFAQGCQPLIGYSFGARKFPRMHRVLGLGAGGVFVLGAALLVVLRLCLVPVVSLFSPGAPTTAMTLPIARAYLWGLPFMGACDLCIVLYQSIGRPMTALGLAATKQAGLLLPLLFAFNAVLGSGGFFFAQPVTDALMWGVAVFFIRRSMKMYPAEG